MTSALETFDQTFRHHTAEVNGVRLHYVIGVLLHGYAQTWYEWRRIMPTLANHYTVLAPDLRGAGDSEKPLTGYDKRSLAESMVSQMQTVADHVQGGAIAQRGHWIVDERPEELTQQLLTFFSHA